MSRRGLIVGWMLICALGAAFVGASAVRACRALPQAEIQLSAFSAIASDARELARCRALIDPAGRSAADAPKLAPMVSGALGEAGLPALALSSLSPESESVESSGEGNPLRAIRRRATLVLAPVTLPQLGRFLSAWRERTDAALWTVARLDIEPQREHPFAPGSDLPLRVVVGLECVTMEPLRASR